MAYPLPDPLWFLLVGLAIGSVIVLAVQLALYAWEQRRGSPPGDSSLEPE